MQNDDAQSQWIQREIQHDLLDQVPVDANCCARFNQASQKCSGVWNPDVDSMVDESELLEKHKNKVWFSRDTDAGIDG